MWWAIAVAWGNEGMWLPEQLPSLQDALTERGITLPATTLANPAEAPLAAVVGLGFCSASFVSPEGLVATNHHCAEGWLADQSTGAVDHLTDGFWATDRAHELPAGAGARLWIVEDIRDVTADVQRAVQAAASDAERVPARDRAISALVARCEKPGGKRCRVASFWAGAEYRLITSAELRDVRIVAAPPAKVGFFGGDRDNFEWPRHDGDFTLLRAYVAPDGRAAAYHPDNVPYRPPHWLTIDPTGAQWGEAALVAGYPGSTERYETIDALRFAYETENPARLAWYREVEALLAEHAGRSDAARAHLASSIFGIENSRKYLQGIQDNVGASSVLADKQAVAARVAAWVAADPSRAAHGEALAAHAARAAEARQTWARDAVIGALLSSDLMAVAHKTVRWVGARAQPDAAREPGLQDRDRARIADGWATLDASLWLPFEEDYLARVFARHAALPAAERVPALDAWITAQGGPEAAARALASNAPATSADYRAGLLDLTPRALAASADPWLVLARTLEAEHLAAERARDRADEGAWLREGPLVLAALRAVQEGVAYPDANGTLRVTFGKVRGYAPRDGLLADPQTTLTGLVAKHRSPHYEAPAWLIDAATAYAADPVKGPGARWTDPERHDIPVAFLTDLDTTGGNSGSATLNGQGQLIGLIYDGNYESMAADWQYDHATTRSIHLDIRYLLWLLEVRPETGWVLRELGQ